MRSLHRGLPTGVRTECREQIDGDRTRQVFYVQLPGGDRHLSRTGHKLERVGNGPVFFVSQGDVNGMPGPQVVEA